MRRPFFFFWLPVNLMLIFALPAARAQPTAPAKNARSWYAAKQPTSAWRLLHRIAEPVEYSEVRLNVGDDPQWAQANFNDSAWRVIARGNPPWVPTHAGVMWLRFRVRWNQPTGRLPEGLHFLFLSGSYQVYWDGVKLGANGVPANRREEEVEGLMEYHPGLPQELTGPGEHQLALRLSTWHATDPYPFTPLLTIVMAPEVFDADFRRDNVLPMMAFGALFAIALAAGIMWIVAARRRVLLLFAGMCFFAGLMEATEWYLLAYIYPVSRLFSLEIAVGATGLLLGVFLVAVLLEEWDVPRKRWWLGLLLLLDAGLIARVYPQIQRVELQFIAAAFAWILGTSVWAGLRGRRGVWIVVFAVGTSAFLLWRDPKHFVGLDFFQGFMPTALGLLLTIALRLGAERRQAQEMKLTAARMEIELLKKSLQPHFLMNTLTALAQTIEENPRAAVQLIGDLAAEFRALARYAGEKQISLAQEIELCRAHLRVMSVRTERTWRLDCMGINPAALVPPALFLTLIENGFSHQQAVDGATTFTLQASESGRGTCYTFLSPGRVRAASPDPTGGTGLRYVKARLEEAWPGNWRLTQRETGGGWETSIELIAIARGTSA